ncbi:MAG: PAS domain S-box protein [Sphingobacteriaceae bacterium]|nr:PAS domain S-box protein [Sphingobacteriaceae bacterium]
MTLSLLVLAATYLIAFQQYKINRSQQERLVHDKASSLHDQLQAVINNAENVSRTLAFIVSRDSPSADFNTIASNLIDGTSYFSGIQLLDSGTITHVYPQKGNEGVIGYNVLADSSRNEELILAISEKRFHLAGPFNLRQGGMGMVGRYPIFKDEGFVGMAAVIIRWEDLKSYMRFDDQSEAAYAIQLFKVDSKSKDLIPLLDGAAKTEHQFCEIRPLPEAAMELHVNALFPTTLATEWPTMLFGMLLAFFSGYITKKLLLEPRRLSQLINDRTQALQESQNLYRDTLLRISDGFASICKDGKILYLNQQAAAHFHLDAEKMIGENAFEYLAYLEGSGVSEGVKRALKTGQNQHFEAQKPTDFRWYSINIYPSNNGVSVFATDITYEKEALRLLELTNEVARIGGWEYHRERRIFNLSPMARQLLRLPDHSGFKVEDLERYFGEHAEKILERLNTLSNNETSFSIEAQVVLGYDPPLWVKINARVMEDVNTGARIYGTIQDIALQKQTQEVITSSARRYRSLFDLNPLPMWTFSWETLTIIDANKAACESYGYERSALLGQSIAILWKDDGFRQYVEGIRSKEPASNFCVHKRKDGSTLQVEVISTPVDQGECMAELLLARDITERLAHLRAIEGQNSRLREIAWLQSHQVRAPLARIMAIVHLLDLEERNAAEDVKLLREIIQSAYELDGIIAEIVKNTELAKLD